MHTLPFFTTVLQKRGGQIEIIYDTNNQDSRGRTVLHQYIRWENQKYAKMHSKLVRMISRRLSFHQMRYSFISECFRVPSLEKDKYVLPVFILKYLRYGGKLDIQDISGNTPLMLAIIHGLKDTALCLIEHGANVNLCNKKKRTALHYAAANECWKDVIELLLKRNTQINTQDKYGNTALHIAANLMYADAVDVLLKHMADPNILNKWGHSAVHCAYIGRSKENILAKLSSNSIPHTKRDCSSKRQKVLLAVLIAGGATNITDEFGDTPLHGACALFDVKSIKTIMEYGGNPNTQNKNGKTPFHVCLGAYAQDVSNVSLRDDPAGRDDGTMIPFHDVCEEVARLILSYGGNPYIQANDGKTPLHVAVEKGLDNVVSVIMKYDGNPDIPDNKGQTPLQYFYNNSCSEKEKEEEELGDLINTQDGFTDLHSVNKSNEVTTMLLARGIDPNIKNEFGDTTLHLACRENSIGVIKSLLISGANPNIQNDKGNTPFHDILPIKPSEILLKYSADPNIQNKRGDTPFHNIVMWFSEKLQHEYIKDNIYGNRYIKGLTEVVEYLLNAGGNPNIQNKQGNTPFHIITDPKYQIKFKFIGWCWEDHEADITNCSNSNAMFICYYSDIVEMVLKNGGNPNIQNAEGNTPFHNACLRGCGNVVKAIANNGGDPNISNKSGNTPFHYASYMRNTRCYTSFHLECTKHSFEITRSVLISGGNPNIQNEEGMTPFLIFTKFTDCPAPLENRQFMNLIEDSFRGADLNNRKIKITPSFLEQVTVMQKNGSYIKLYYAAFRDLHIRYFQSIIAQMIDNGGDPNISDRSGNTAFHYVSSKIFPEKTIEVMVKNDGNPNKQNEAGETPFHMILKKPCKEVIESKNLKTLFPIISKRKRFRNLHHTCSKVKSVRGILENGGNPNLQNEKGETPFHDAVKLGCDRIVSVILENGGNPNISNEFGETPFHLACRKFSASSLENILKNDGNPNSQNNSGETPLHLVISKRYETVISTMLSNGGNPNIHNRNGVTPRDQAFERNISKRIRCRILEYDISPNIPREGATELLFRACRCGSPHIVKLLLKSGLNPNIKDEKGFSLLHAALTGGQNSEQIVQFLLDKGSDPNDECYNTRSTPLHVGCSHFKAKMNLKAITAILKNGGNPNKQNHLGKTPLHVTKFGKVASIILDYGGKLNILDREENTALHIACERGYASVVKLLLSKGADPNIRNIEGETPLHKAARKSCEDNVSSLICHGANLDIQNNLGDTALDIARLYGHEGVVKFILSKGEYSDEQNLK